MKLSRSQSFSIWSTVLPVCFIRMSLSTFLSRWFSFKRIKISVVLPRGPRAQEHRAHAGGLADAVGGDITGDVLHRVVDAQSRRDGAARAVDVQMDIRLRLIELQIQHLGDDQARAVVVHLALQKD